MAAKPVLHLHLGVHKTGSTFLQRVFLESLSGNNFEDTVYIPLADMRRRVTPAVLRAAKGVAGLGRGGLRDCRQLLITSLEGAGSIVLSDENLLGSLYCFSRDKGLYPGAPENLRALINLFEGNIDVVIYLSVRNYSSWLESAYLQFLKKRKKLVAFKEFIELASVDSMSWYALVRRLSAAAPAARVVLWRYEDFLDNNQKILDGISRSLGHGRLALVDFSGNPSLSAVAYEILMAARSAGIRGRDARPLVKFVRSHFAASSVYPKPKLFGAGDRKSLSERYEKDLSLLLGLGNVVLIG
jgi:hypothetical protein